MKIRISVFIVLLLCLSLTGCLNRGPQQKYTDSDQKKMELDGASEVFGESDVSVYDTKTGQYFYIGQSKQEVENFLGASMEIVNLGANGVMCYYDKSFSIDYGDDNKAHTLHIRWYNSESERYEIGVFTAQSKKSDFLTLYPKATTFFKDVKKAREQGAYIEFKRVGNDYVIDDELKKYDEKICLRAEFRTGEAETIYTTTITANANIRNTLTN